MLQPVVSSEGEPVYVERPSVSRISTGLVLVGSPSFEWVTDMSVQVHPRSDTAAALAHPLLGVLLTPRGRAVAIPPSSNDSALKAPVILDVEGERLILWQAAQGVAADHGVARSEIRAGSFIGGALGASAPILDVKYIAWSKERASTAIIDGDPSFAAPAYDDTGGASVVGIVFMRRTDHGWLRSWIPTEALPAQYVSLAAHGTHPTVAFLGTVRASNQVRKGVFVTESPDDGRTWGTPVLVDEFDPREDGWLPHLESLSDGTMHLLWAVRRSGKESSDSVAHYVRQAQSPSWHQSKGLPVKGGTDVLEITKAPAGGMLLLLRNPRSRVVRVISWQDGEWRGNGCSLGEPSQAVPVIAIGENDTVYIFTGTVREVPLGEHHRAYLPTLLFTTLPYSRPSDGGLPR